MVLLITGEEKLAKKVKEFRILYDKLVKGYKEKDAVKDAWGKVPESLDFTKEV